MGQDKDMKFSVLVRFLGHSGHQPNSHSSEFHNSFRFLIFVNTALDSSSEKNAKL